MKNIQIRDNVSTIEQLKPYSMYKPDGVTRYCFHQMRGIVETNLGFDTRGCENDLVKLGFDIPQVESLFINDDTLELKYCDFWHFQLDCVFRTEVRNDSTNTIYVGTSEGIDLKKLKEQPNDWQLMILKEWNKTFHHLADKYGKIKIEMWW